VGDTRSIEISHEALIGEWARLKDWIADARAELRLQQRIAADADTWKGRNRTADLLYRGEVLAEAEAWARRNPTKSELERAFIQASSEAQQQRDMAEQAERTRKLLLHLVTRFVGAAVGFAVGMGVIIYVLFGAGTETLTRLRSAFALGIQYGLLMAFAVVLVVELPVHTSPKERTTRTAWVLAAGALAFAAVFVLFRLSRGQTLGGWGWLLLSGLVLAASFTASSLLNIPGWAKCALVIGGIFVAVYGPWLLAPDSYPLFPFTSAHQPLLLSLWTAGALGTLTFLPELYHDIAGQFKRAGSQL
jgi:hypothetical protein